MKKLLITICILTGCNSPEIRDLEQRNLRLVLIQDQETGRRYIDEEQSACFARYYRHSKEYLGPVGQSSSHDILHCNDIIGYDSADYVDLADFFEQVRIKVNKKTRSK